MTCGRKKKERSFTLRLDTSCNSCSSLLAFTKVLDESLAEQGFRVQGLGAARPALPEMKDLLFFILLSSAILLSRDATFHRSSRKRTNTDGDNEGDDQHCRNEALQVKQKREVPSRLKTPNTLDPKP